MPSTPTSNISADNPHELFDTYSEAGEKLTPQLRAEVHTRGIWHCAVNVMLFRTSGELVLQQRAAAKSVCPLAWDLSVAEHLQVAEGWEAAAHRGLAEELGLANVRLEPWGPEIQERHDDPGQGIKNYEFQRCFRGVSDAQVHFDSVEVAAIRELNPAQFRAEVASTPEQFTPWLLAWAQLLELTNG